MPAVLPPVRQHLALRAEHLAKRFGGVEAVVDVSFEVRPGEILGVIGPNGSGKTTLVNLLTGVEQVDRGRVWLGQTEITAAPTHRIARLGLARSFQSAVHGDFSALQRVMLATGVVGPTSAAAGRAQAWLDRLGIGMLGGRRLAELPPAVARLVDLARALALDPSVLLLDEPAAGLGERERTELAILLRELADEGRAFVVVEHDMRFLMELADRMLCLDGGRVVAEGTPVAIRADPRVRAVYLGDE
jgi:branched-chain amino acid transport system permease protein